MRWSMKHKEIGYMQAVVGSSKCNDLSLKKKYTFQKLYEEKAWNVPFTAATKPFFILFLFF